MPQKYLKYNDYKLDGRCKLGPDQKKEILLKYQSGKGSWKSLALEYGVSKRTIGTIVNPATLEKMKQRRKEVWHDYYIHYGKEYKRKAVAKWRNKKRSLGLV